MFINFTNHAVSTWSDAQKEAAKEYGDFAEVEFPNVSPYSSADDVKLLAEGCVSEIVSLLPKDEKNAVLCQGEFSLCVAVTEGLKAQGIKVLCACSERQVVESFNGKTNTKTVVFVFVGYREM